MKMNGIRIAHSTAGSPAWNAGLRKGDYIVAVNGEPVGDELDFTFLSAVPSSQIDIRRNGIERRVLLEHQPPVETGLSFARRPVSRCANRCIFCFVDQMPPRMRRSLYIKDEDFRHSFLYGNYITLTTLKPDDLHTIIRLRLSPLYISVHALQLPVRRRLLGILNPPDILARLRILAVKGIAFHTQIVVCPGINDGKVLRQTLCGLLRLGKRLLSIAVVPVGLTRFHRHSLTPVDKAAAQEICREVGRIGDADYRRIGMRRVFTADELFIKAGLPIPPTRYYEDFAQIENGVGLVRRMLDEWEPARRRFTTLSQASGTVRSSRRRDRLVITSHSALSFLSRICAEITTLLPSTRISVVAVDNQVFGGSVTVAGLLTARDIIRTVHRYAGRIREVIVPGVIFNYNHVTLDGYSPERLQRGCRVRIHVVENLSDLITLLLPARTHHRGKENRPKPYRPDEQPVSERSPS
jgi:putative radical SAM enzyme (TIGR03279 family)